MTRFQEVNSSQLQVSLVLNKADPGHKEQNKQTLHSLIALNLPHLNQAHHSLQVRERRCFDFASSLLQPLKQENQLFHWPACLGNFRSMVQSPYNQADYSDPVVPLQVSL